MVQRASGRARRSRSARSLHPRAQGPSFLRDFAARSRHLANPRVTSPVGAERPLGRAASIDYRGSISERTTPEHDAKAWLATIGAETVATVAASPHSTIVPTFPKPTTSGERALAVLDELVKNPHELRLGKIVGEGGMGVVREAEQVTLGRTVAVKTLKTEQHDPSSALDLLREAWVTGELEHPNVVPVHYLSITEDGRPSIVMKRIEGAEWSRLLGDPPLVAERFGADDLLAWNLGILLQVLNAVRFAHRHGIIHRDLKPANVMIGDYGEVYLLDWGIAVSLHDDGTGRFSLACNATQLAGTPSYLAPEMLGREGGPPLSKRTDVYLAGAVLYELITGKPPHTGTTPLAVIASVIASRPQFPPHAPPELARICERAMHEDPDRRYESIDALRDAIQHYLAHRGSELLANRARERLGDLRAALRTGARQEDVYRLFGACRYGFRDAIAAWPDNPEARRGLVEAVVAVAEYELAADRPQAAVSLLGELDEPHPLQATAREAVQSQALRVAALEKLGREHDHDFGARTRLAIALAFGGAFTVFPLLVAHVDALLPLTFRDQFLFDSLCVVVVGIAWVVARETLNATAINRRLAAAFALLFASHAFAAVGGWLAGFDPASLPTWNLFVTFTIVATTAITVERWLWAVAVSYLAAFLIASREPRATWYGASAANAVFTILVVWRWRPLRSEARDRR